MDNVALLPSVLSLCTKSVCISVVVTVSCFLITCLIRRHFLVHPFHYHLFRLDQKWSMVVIQFTSSTMKVIILPFSTTLKTCSYICSSQRLTLKKHVDSSFSYTIIMSMGLNGPLYLLKFNLSHLLWSSPNIQNHHLELPCQLWSLSHLSPIFSWLVYFQRRPSVIENNYLHSRTSKL